MKKLLLILLCLPMIGLGQCISGNCKNGQGTYNYPNSGNKYVGQWKDYKRDGQGTFTWANGDKYVGEFKDGNLHGQGTLNYASGENYVGELKYGNLQQQMVHKQTRKHGQGTFTWASGSKYVGQWKDDFRNGQGTFTYADGGVLVGIWQGGEMLEDLTKSFMKKSVEQKVNEWQQKGEFEKTNDYLVRVNEKNRTVKIKEFQEAVIFNFELGFLNYIDFSNIELGDYDADNETFLLKDNKLGNLVIPVPISEAREFKENFSLYNFINPECVIIDDKFVLSYVEVTRKSKDLTKYTYNLDNAQDYTITEIDYEFSSIEIDDIKSSKTTKSSRISTNKLKVGESSVNINIPTNKKVKNRYALIIGNEDYISYQRTLSSEQNVDYAVNDAKVFKEYALKTLGVKEDNMFFLTDATSIEMNRKIELVSKIIKKLGSTAELIVYYAGHGYPDETTKVPYLIPVDVPASDLSYAIKLDDFYKDLSATGAKSITVFLDACFTGGGRESGLMASRGVKIKPKEGSLSGNLVVFSASSGNQSALPYHQQGHGMFTYHLLKKLQESKGKVSMGALADYIQDQVSIQSLKTNEKEQDPTVNTSSKVMNDWRNWKF